MNSQPERRRRVQLAVPASNQRMIVKAAAGDADHVFLDLEDAVAPSAKDDARRLAIRSLHDLDWGRKTRCVRINDLGTPHFYKDITQLVAQAGEKLDTIMVPKVTSPGDVQFVDRLLGLLEQEAGLKRRIGIEILIEEIAGLMNVEAICAASDRLESAILGVGDYSAAQGIDRQALNGASDYPGDMWHYARFKLIVACRASRLHAIDGPFPDLKNADGYRASCRQAAILGFDGKWALHPDQIPVALEQFSPAVEEIEVAREQMALYKDAEAKGIGAVAHNGVMVDVGSVRLLRNVLRKAELFGM